MPSLLHSSLLLSVPLTLCVAFAAEKEPVNFRELKALLPETLGGLERNNAEGQSFNMEGSKFSQAIGHYGGEDSTAELQMMDYAGMPNMASGFAYWQDMEIDQESDTGWERTVDLSGHRAMLTWTNGEDGEHGSGSAMVVIDRRFLVILNIHHITPEQFEAAQKELPLAKIAELGK